MLWPGAWAAPRSSWEEADVSAAEQHGVIHSEESWAFTLNSATGLLLGCSVSSFPGKADLLLKTWLRFTPEKFCRSTSGCNEPIILIYPHKIGKYLSPRRNFHKAQWFNSSLITRLRMHPSSDQLIQLKNSGKLSSTWSSTCYVCRLTQFNLIKYSLFTQSPGHIFFMHKWRGLEKNHWCGTLFSYTSSQLSNVFIFLQRTLPLAYI